MLLKIWIEFIFSPIQKIFIEHLLFAGQNTMWITYHLYFIVMKYDNDNVISKIYLH